MRFWDHEILNNLEVVLEAIRLNLENPHPDPLPEREREFKGTGNNAQGGRK